MTNPRAELHAALAAFHAERPVILKSKTADMNKFKIKYADLGTILETINPTLHKHNLAFYQRAQCSGTSMGVETVIVHTNGEQIECGVVSISSGKNDAQALGSALTYARRYSLCCALGLVADDDDDGERSVNRAAQAASGLPGVAPAQAPSGQPTFDELSEAIMNALTKDDLEAILPKLTAARSYLSAPELNALGSTYKSAREVLG